MGATCPITTEFQGWVWKMVELSHQLKVPLLSYGRDISWHWLMQDPAVGFAGQCFLETYGLILQHLINREKKKARTAVRQRVYK